MKTTLSNHTKTIILLFVIISFCHHGAGQSNWVYNSQFNLGCHLNITYGKGQKFPGLRIFSGFSITGVNKEHFIINYGPSLSIYTKTIGANLNPLVGDIQIDFTNSFSAGYGWGGVLAYQKNFRTIHTGDYYNISLNIKNAVLLSTNFILNNHKRHQVVGSFSGTFGKFTFNYSNDGAFPFNMIPLADNFDRYWTGGGAIFIHTEQDFNRAELSFDQFTGYTPLLYEAANLLGINIPLYKSDEDNQGRWPPPNYFNTSAYQLKIFADKNFALDAGVVGSLTDKNGKHYGVQDLIHMALGMSLHPNNDINRFFIGGTYNNRQHVKL